MSKDRAYHPNKFFTPGTSNRRDISPSTQEQLPLVPVPGVIYPPPLKVNIPVNFPPYKTTGSGGNPPAKKLLNGTAVSIAGSVPKTVNQSVFVSVKETKTLLNSVLHFKRYSLMSF